MIERIDQELFLWLNSMNSPFLDNIMWIISGRLTWVPLYLLILTALIIREKRKMLVLILFIALAITLSDQFSLLIKNSVQRPRPCHEPALEGMVHIVKNRCGGQFGFVSSHASNSFTVALLGISLLRRRWITYGLVFWALLVGYSRIYLGVHYPGDVIFGSLLGALIGWGTYLLYRLADNRILAKRGYYIHGKKEPEDDSGKH
jgi:undecaprenyl-diphosphatase